MSPDVSMELHGGSWRIPGCALGLDGDPVPVLSAAPLVAQTSPATPAGRGLHISYPQEDSCLALGCQRLPTQLLSSRGYLSNKLQFGTANTSCSVDLSTLLQGHFGEPPLKIWTPMPPPTASNTQSQLGLWWIYAFPKGNGGRRTARRRHLKRPGNSAVPHVWKISCPSASSGSGKLVGKSDGRFSSALALSAPPEV